VKDKINSDSLNEFVDYGDGSQWHETIQLLRLVQSDYQGTRRQLEKVSNTLAERETLVNQRLQYALLTSSDYKTLCLTPSDTGTAVSQIGKTILGEIVPPDAIPAPIHLEMRYLGRFEVRSSWKQVIRWQSAKAKTILQYIMTRPREPIIKEVLMEALWPECDPRAANNNLKAAMHGLRQTLNYLFEENENIQYVLFLQGSYLINPEIELWVDVEEFERYWVKGRQLEKEKKYTEAIQQFELAETLYRGDYLEDEPYEEWTLLRREALKDTYVIILGKLADYSIRSADYESTIVYCQKILAKDACREDAYRRLMTCYSRLGQRNRALRWYEICQRTIKAELDTVPDNETASIYQKLLKNEFV
jgi:DNA-binding SARP family transcriptional activator